MAFLTDTLSAQGSLSEKLAAVWSRFVEGASKRSIYRQTVRELSELTNRELTDLGLTRSEIRRVAYQAAYGK